MSTDSNIAKSELLVMNAAATLVETLLYGIHFVLFCICMFILIRNRRLTQWFILVSAFAMFALSTADISITFQYMTHDIKLDLLDLGGSLYRPVQKSKDLIFVSNNFIAELTLSYRCYVIWGRPKRLLVLTSCLLLSDTIWGYLCVTDRVPQFLSVYLWSVFAINILISGITAGRIFWVAHIAQPFLGHRHLRHFHLIIATLVETSVVYSACIFSYLLLGTQPIYQLVPTAIGMRLVAIMPTLMIVQVGLVADRTAGGPNDCERLGTRSVVLDTIVTTNYENQDTSGVMGMQSRDTLDDGQDPRSLSIPNVTPILRAEEG